MTASIPTFTRYLYLGPVQSVELTAEVDGKTVSFLEETFHPDQSYLLPEGHSIVEGWKEMGVIKQEPAIEGEAQ